MDTAFEIMKWITGPKFIFFLGTMTSLVLFLMGLARDSKPKMTASVLLLLLVAWWGWKGGAIGRSGGLERSVPKSAYPPHALPAASEGLPAESGEKDIDVVIEPAENSTLEMRFEEMRRQLSETAAENTRLKESLSETQAETERLRALNEDQEKFLSRLGTGPHPGTLLLRYTEAGDPEFSAQITPATGINCGSGAEFNSELRRALNEMAALPQYRFDRLCIVNADLAGSSQIEEAENAARESFPDIRVEKISQGNP